MSWEFSTTQSYSSQWCTFDCVVNIFLGNSQFSFSRFSGIILFSSKAKCKILKALLIPPIFFRPFITRKTSLKRRLLCSQTVQLNVFARQHCPFIIRQLNERQGFSPAKLQLNKYANRQLNAMNDKAFLQPNCAIDCLRKAMLAF